MGAGAQVNDSYSGMGVAGGDYDLDGRFDVVVTNMGNQMHSLYLNQSTETGFMFQDAAAVLELAAGEAEWTGWGTSWADMDLDGDQDLLVINGNIPVLDLAADAQLTQFYANQAREGQPGHFVEMTGPVGLAQIGPLLGRGGAAADYDNDGDMDIAIND
ncbi:MAG: VCBS repeat-containing protein [Chloroflexi bacterium]|nr:VCBS repeat-containing protein [Chloroflexota bacterium]